MVSKARNTGSDNTAGGSGPDLSGIKDSAQQIWLAGLGAFAKAQEEGSKVFDTLVKEGATMQRKTQSAASEKLSEATERMEKMATEISSRASGQWDKLETIFEGRVSKALHKLEVPTVEDFEMLSARVAELERKLSRPGSARTPAGKRPAAKGAPQPAVKRKPARKAS